MQKKVLNYTNSITNESLNITTENIDKTLNSINTKDLGLIHIQSNQGENRYVIDNDANDEFDLIGP